MRLHARGFTLIELLVAVVVIAILAAIAIPNYSAYVTRGKRAAAKTELLNAAQALERNYTTNGCYNFTSVAACQAQSGTAYTLPVRAAPADGRATHEIAVDTSGSATGQAYVLSAIPCAAGGNCPAGAEAFTDADCGTLTLAHTSARGSSAGTAATCWQR